VGAGDPDHFIQSLTVLADVVFDILHSVSRKELLRLPAVWSSGRTVNLYLFHNCVLLRLM
jgi:hypothetical protein